MTSADRAPVRIGTSLGVTSRANGPPQGNDRGGPLRLSEGLPRVGSSADLFGLGSSLTTQALEPQGAGAADANEELWRRGRADDPQRVHSFEFIALGAIALATTALRAAFQLTSRSVIPRPTARSRRTGRAPVLFRHGMRQRSRGARSSFVGFRHATQKEHFLIVPGMRSPGTQPRCTPLRTAATRLK